MESAGEPKGEGVQRLRREERVRGDNRRDPLRRLSEKGNQGRSQTERKIWS